MTERQAAKKKAQAKHDTLKLSRLRLFRNVDMEHPELLNLLASRCQH